MLKKEMERGINAEQINLCIEYGDVFYKTGMTFFYVKEMFNETKNLYGTYLSAFEGIVVMARKTKDGLMIVTVYRNRNASKIKKRNKHTTKGAINMQNITAEKLKADAARLGFHRRPMDDLERIVKSSITDEYQSHLSQLTAKRGKLGEKLNKINDVLQSTIIRMGET